MGNNKRSKIEREADLTAIAQLYKRGHNMRQIQTIICDKRPYTISHVMVKHDLDLVFKRWRKAQVAYIDNFVTVQLEQIQEMKAECWQEYLRSKLPAKSIKEKRTPLSAKLISKRNQPEHEELSDLELDKIFEDYPDEPDDLKEVSSVDINFMSVAEMEMEIEQTVQIVERLGNPKYLQLIDTLMEREAKLLNIYNVDDAKQVPSVVVVNMPPPISASEFTPTIKIGE